MKTLMPIAALLTSAAFLLAANGLHGLLLPLRADSEGFSTTEIGLIGTGWAIGFVLSSLVTPMLVRRAGHIRAFSVFAATAAIIALVNTMIISPAAWMFLRGCSGFVMAGGMMVVESWLNERSSNKSRGTIFGIYMSVNFASITGGQLMTAAGNPMQDVLFMVVAIMFCLAVLPTALSKAASPKPLTNVSLNLKKLFRFSPVAFLSAILIGVINGAFGALGPLFGIRVGLSPVLIAGMMSLAILAGAVMQLPIGRISDLTDRRYVLAAGACGAGLAGVAIFTLQPTDAMHVFALTSVYGALTYPLYSLAVAHANDFAGADDFVAVSGGLLMLYGVGTMIGPAAASLAIENFGPAGLFMVTATAHFIMAAYAVYRTRMREPVPEEARDVFKGVPAPRALTPETVALDPRAEDRTEASESVDETTGSNTDQRS